MRRLGPALLFAFGYPVSIAVILRLGPVMRERRVRWFAAHQVAVAAIVAGWLIRDRTPAVVVNAAWLLIAGAWWLWAGKRKNGRP